MKKLYATLFFVASLALITIAFTTSAGADDYGSTPELSLPVVGDPGHGTIIRNAFKDLVDFTAIFANSDGTLKTTVTATPWQQVTGPVTWLTPTSFKVPETALFDDIGRKVWVNQTTDVLGSVEAFATAAGETTVTLTGIVLYSDNYTPSTITDPITSVSVSMVTPRSTPPPGYSRKNALTDGGMRVWQQGETCDASTTPANNDDTYCGPDLANLLSDGDDVVDITKETTDVPTGSYAAIKYVVQTANKQFGHVFFIEAQDAARFIGGSVSLSFDAKTTTAKVINNLRAAVLAWDGAEDAPETDVVTTWAATPTWATNWTAENTPGDLALTTSWQTFTIENISIDTSGAKNIAVAIWIADTDAATNDELFITDVQLEQGTTATAFEFRLAGQELAHVQRRFYRWGQSTTTVMRTYASAGGMTLKTFLSLPVEMASTPSATKTGTWAVENCGQPTVSNPTTRGATLNFTSTADGITSTGPNSVDDYIKFDSRF